MEALADVAYGEMQNILFSGIEKWGWLYTLVAFADDENREVRRIDTIMVRPLEKE